MAIKSLAIFIRSCLWLGANRGFRAGSFSTGTGNAEVGVFQREEVRGLVVRALGLLVAMTTQIGSRLPIKVHPLNFHYWVAWAYMMRAQRVSRKKNMSCVTPTLQAIAVIVHSI